MILLTTGEVASRLSVCNRTVRTMIKSRQLPAIRVGAEYRIDEMDLVKFIDNNRVSSAVETLEKEDKTGETVSEEEENKSE